MSTIAAEVTTQAATAPDVDLAALKAKQRAAWGSGDYSIIGTTLQIVGETICEAADVCPDERVLDVAAGNGNATLAAARRFADVTATDYVSTLLDDARARALAEKLPIHFQLADAENLPFDDGSFDVVLSTFGVMFTADHARAARELLRVCRSGGRIALANWTPEGFVGRMFKVLGRHVPPPAAAKSPALWGTPAYLTELFGADAARIVTERRLFNLRYRSAAHFVEVFRNWYGPVHKAFAALGARSESLERDLLQLLGDGNTGGARTLTVPSEYLEVVVTRA